MIRSVYSICSIVVVCCILVRGAAEDKIKIACIGNSITYGYGVDWNESYPYRLQELFGTDEYTVENDGVNSLTLLKNGDNPYYRNGKLPEVFTFQPDIITIKLGTNDTKPQNWDLHHQEFKADYLWLIDTLSGMASRPTIWLLLPVPVFRNPIGERWGIRDSIVRKIIPLIEEVADERELPVIDMYTPLQQFPEYFSVDGVHPDAAGLDTIAHIIYRTLKEVTETILPGSGRNTRYTIFHAPVTGINFMNMNAEAVATRGTVLDIAGRKMFSDNLNSVRKKAVFRWYVTP